MLLYCNTFSANEIRVITASPEFASRLPKLFRRAFGVSFDRLPPEGAEGKRTLSITDADKLSAIFDAFGADRGATLSHHINFGVIEEECCRASFIRGAFLAGGSVTDPEKRYHLELATSPPQRQPRGVFDPAGHGLQPKETERAGNSLLYFKQADAIADFFTTIGRKRDGHGHHDREGRKGDAQHRHPADKLRQPQCRPRPSPPRRSR